MQCRGEVRSESFERQRCLSIHLELELAIDDDLANRGLVYGGFVSVRMGGGEQTNLELYIPAKQQKRVIVHRRGLPHIQFLRVPRYRPSEPHFSTSHKPHSTYMSVKYIKHIPPPTISSGRFLKLTELGWNATGRLFPNVCILPFSTIRSLGNNPAASAALIAQDSLLCAFVLRSGGKETNRMRWREVKRALVRACEH